MKIIEKLFFHGFVFFAQLNVVHLKHAFAHISRMKYLHSKHVCCTYK